MSQTTDNSTYSNPTAQNVYYVIWAMFAILVFFLPCFIFPRQRILCFKRIRERRWNVSIDEDQIGSIVLGGGNFRPRYPRDDPRHVVTKEESERSKREFILKKLKDFTKTLEESDFVMKNASDFGEAVKEAESRRQSMLGNVPVPGDHPRNNDNHHNNSNNSSSNNNNKNFNVVVSTILSAWNGNPHSDPHVNRVVHDPIKKQDPSVPDGGTENDSRCALGPVIPQADTEQGLANSSSSPSQDICMGQQQQQQQPLIRVLRLPLPGKTLQDMNQSSATYNETTTITSNDNNNNNDDDNQNALSLAFREIIPECCICLNDFNSGDVISWSPEEKCSHSFHKACIVKWFLAVCQRNEARRTRRSHDIGCSLQCPVCRQDFIAISASSSSSESDAL